MVWIIPLPLEPGEAPVCVSNFSSSLCSDEGQEETVTEVMTLNKHSQCIEHLGLTLAAAKQLLSILFSDTCCSTKSTPFSTGVPAGEEGDAGKNG
jgi:hypothetical protein